MKAVSVGAERSVNTYGAGSAIAWSAVRNPPLSFAVSFCGTSPESVSSGMFRVAAVYLLLSAFARPLVECRVGANPSFMIAAGVSAENEQCLVAAGPSVSLSSCAKAVASGDGSDIWSFSNGQLVSTASSKCFLLQHIFLWDEPGECF